MGDIQIRTNRTTITPGRQSTVKRLGLTIVHYHTVLITVTRDSVYS